MIAKDNTEPEIPKTCKAGVVANEGPDFKLTVEDVPVPEPGTPPSHTLPYPYPSRAHKLHR